MANGNRSTNTRQPLINGKFAIINHKHAHGIPSVKGHNDKLTICNMKRSGLMQVGRGCGSGCVEAYISRGVLVGKHGWGCDNGWDV